nr:phosphoenolpyruvate-protein phosphotransferase-like [Nerophis lumbriciformis]
MTRHYPRVETHFMVKREFTITNKLGIHARPAAQFVKTANRFSSEVRVLKDDDEVDGKSILGLMMLAAGHGSVITLTAEGDDAENAIQALDSHSQEQIFQGTPVSRGIAIAPVHVTARGFQAPDLYSIHEDAIAQEIRRFEYALGKTRDQLQKLQKKIETISGDEEAKIFEAHVMILNDPSIHQKVSEAIKRRKQNAEFCFYAVMQTLLEAMRRVSDPYLRERTVDIEDVSQRVLRNFKDEDHFSSPNEQHILVAYDLNPSDTAAMDRNKLLGFITEAGSVNSHTAVLARALGIPAIIGLEGAVLNFTSLAPAILDGYTGKITLHPSEETLHFYREELQRRQEARSALDSLKDQESATTDGHHITLSANIEFVSELDLIRQNRAEGIGLYRTEFFLLEGPEPPTEDQQTQIYSSVVQHVAPHGAIIRTLDAGGDKLPAEPLSESEPNPFLGWRGIRVSLSRTGLFKEQLRAILRASAHGKTGIMFPLVSGLSEVRQAREILAQCMAELDHDGIPYDRELEVGAMIEVPSAALMAEEIAQEVDFFSFGTNDLIQYTIAVDRVNHRVANLYKPTHPAVIRLMKMTTDAAKKHGIWSGVCGEMAGDLALTPLLVGLGIDELSVGPHEIPAVRKAIISLDKKECENLAHEALSLPSSPEILVLCEAMAQEKYPELLI